jgi:hypothetical protein
MKFFMTRGRLLLQKGPGRSTGGAGLKKSIVACAACVCLLLLFLASPTPGLAQKDKTGTNPVNFTYDFRIYTEMAQFKDDGGSLLSTTFEFRWPLGRDIANLLGQDGSKEGSKEGGKEGGKEEGKEEGGKEGGSLFYDMGQRFGMRFRAKYQNLSVDTSGAVGTSDVSGIGDFDARLLGIAYASEKVVIAPGLEVFFDTASNDGLKAGTTRLAPVVFAVFPGILGGKSLFAPGYQYVFDISGDGPDVSRSQIDLYFVWLLAKGKNWLIVDPQIILDHENSSEAMTVEAEWGFMIVPKYGISGWMRPGAGVGSDKPYSWNFEAGIKFVWR